MRPTLWAWACVLCKRSKRAGDSDCRSSRRNARSRGPLLRLPGQPTEQAPFEWLAQRGAGRLASYRRDDRVAVTHDNEKSSLAILSIARRGLPNSLRGVFRRGAYRRQIDLPPSVQRQLAGIHRNQCARRFRRGVLRNPPARRGCGSVPVSGERGTSCEDVRPRRAIETFPGKGPGCAPKDCISRRKNLSLGIWGRGPRNKIKLHVELRSHTTVAHFRRLGAPAGTRGPDFTAHEI